MKPDLSILFGLTKMCSCSGECKLYMEWYEYDPSIDKLFFKCTVCKKEITTNFEWAYALMRLSKQRQVLLMNTDRLLYDTGEPLWLRLEKLSEEMLHEMGKQTYEFRTP